MTATIIIVIAIKITHTQISIQALDLLARYHF